VIRSSLAVIGIAAAVSGPILGALDSSAVAGELDVQITTVRASEHGPSDDQLIAIKSRLRRLVGYRSYRIVRDERRRCTFGQREAFKIPGGRLLRVVPKGMRDEAVMMQIQLVQGARALVDTDVRLQNRGVMLFGVNRDESTDQEGALIIMVRAED
jgi:hypothetical protein